MFYNLVTDAKNTIAVKEFCRSDSERGSLSSLDIDIRPTEYLTRDSVTSLHYRSLQNQALLPMSVVADVPVRPKHLQCTTDIPSRKRFHTAPREKHRVSLKIYCDSPILLVLLIFFLTFGSIFVLAPPNIRCRSRTYLLALNKGRQCIALSNIHFFHNTIM